MRRAPLSLTSRAMNAPCSGPICMPADGIGAVRSRSRTSAGCSSRRSWTYPISSSVTSRMRGMRQRSQVSRWLAGTSAPSLPAEDEELGRDRLVGQVLGQVEQPAEVLALGLVAVHAAPLGVEVARDVDPGRDLLLAAAEFDRVALLRLDRVTHLRERGRVRRVQLVRCRCVDDLVEVPRQVDAALLHRLHQLEPALPREGDLVEARDLPRLAFRCGVGVAGDARRVDVVGMAVVAVLVVA